MNEKNGKTNKAIKERKVSWLTGWLAGWLTDWLASRLHQDESFMTTEATLDFD
jgi:hypothetical protein